MSFLEWRKFNFFEPRRDVDGGAVAEALQEATVTACTCGHSHLAVGDSEGRVHLFTRAWKATTFKAYDRALYLAAQLKRDPYLVTVGEDEVGIKCVIKVWDWSRRDGHGNVPCVRVTKMTRTRATPTCLAVHENGTLTVLGFDDGTVTLFKGDVTRHRGRKETEMRPRPGDPTPITGLAFKGTSHLFVSSRSTVTAISLGSGGKEKATPLDEGDGGCRRDCAALMQDQQFFVARDDAVYCYTTDGRGPCYALEGIKKRIDWFRSYLVVVSKKSDTSDGDLITVLDIQNKFIVFSMSLNDVRAVLTEWGGFYILTEDLKVHHLDEKDLQSKLSMLFKKNLYDVALRIVEGQNYDGERLIDIYTQYGDHLFNKGDPKGAIEQYVKTIGRLETSYVIRKYLESRQLEPLTFYLQELHKLGSATEDHTTLLLTCLVKLDRHGQYGKLREFIDSKTRVIDYDVEIAIKVCRQVNSDDALHLARSHGQHDWYLKIMTEDKKDFSSALEYVADLEFEFADANMKKYGNILMQHIPAETTDFLKLLCVNYKPRSKNLKEEETFFECRIEKAHPEDYLHLFLNNSELLVKFLEYLIECDTDWPPQIYNTLIEHYLHVWSSLADRPGEREACEQKTVRLLQSSEANYDRDQTLIVCLMLNFKPGILYLYEEYKLYRQILRYHISQKDMDAAMNCCNKFGDQEPHLWVEMLWCPPPPRHLPQVLNVIAKKRLLSPLLVIDCLASSSSCLLSDVRKYLMDVLTNEEEVCNRETSAGEKLRAETERGRVKLEQAAVGPLVCQVSRCGACSRPLELPTRHFLCNHSYHRHCIQSFSESEDECPNCVSNNSKLMEVLRNQGIDASTTEAFHARLEKGDDGFHVVAEYFGRGVFDGLTVITEKDVAVESLRIDLPRLPVGVEQPSVDRPSVTEARLRLEEGRGAPEPSESSSSARSVTPKSAVLKVTSEARTRLAEQRGSEDPPKSKGSPSSLRSSGTVEPKLPVSANPFEEDESKNPFEEDESDYDDSKNPFAA